MKRRVSLPFSRESVYRALMDPILLAGWLDLPAVSTGYGKLHLFELEEWEGPDPWKVRGFILDNVYLEGFRVEKDEVGTHEKPSLFFRLSDPGTTDEEAAPPVGCCLELEANDPYFHRTIRAFLDPKGHTRLRHLIGLDTVNFPETV